MIQLQKIGLNVQYLANYFIQNRSDRERIVADFGEVEKDNGYGTFFLKAKNPLFKVFWIHFVDEKLMTVGFGGPNLDILLSDLFSVYKNYSEGFSRYDEEYVYTFYTSSDFQYTIRIFSPVKLFEGGRMLADILMNGLEISLR